ncbi:hypothetical protein B566_EDAN015048 [Ephemera danica]|nr:hypothetical protein B566_EDAN015048 [Ephemera danica]
MCEKWLSCKPHSSKFMLTELPDILRTSLLRSQANTNQELALDEVANAFLALAKYAANIVSQPWRQEFYTIKRYGGYFLQEVGLVLSDIDKLMAFIGYQSSDNNTFNLNIQFSPTVVLQKLPRVALDYMLVATECQVCFVRKFIHFHTSLFSSQAPIQVLYLQSQAPTFSCAY